MRLLLVSLIVVALGACGDDESVAPPDTTPDAGTAAREFTLRIENIAPWTVLKAGTQSTRPNMTEGPLAPGDAYEMRFTAANGHFLSFAAMFGESNDWFFAPGPEGIPLFSDGQPIAGDITGLVRLWDAGTELDQEPAVGDATGTRQTARNVGDADPDATVREVPVTARLGNGSTFVRPEISAMIRVTLTPGPEQQFTLRIENVSTATTLVTSQGALPVHVSPYAWAVHRTPAPIFTPGERARDNGLETLAEAGLPDSLGTALRNVRGAATALSPGVFVVHRAPAPLFTPGSLDYGAGLERIAEDGDPSALIAALTTNPPVGASAVGTFDTPLDARAPAPAQPGQAYELVVRGEPGDSLSFATMFGMSNDWYFATRPEGIALFYGNIPRACDVTSDVILYDLGTESDEELDVGPNTAPHQPAPNTGRPDRDTTVREVTLERYGVPEVLHLRVMLTPR